jgi:hypothetical protein
MAIAAWKRFEKTPQWQRKKRFLKRLIGKELRLQVEVDLPLVKQGGWWFSPEGLDERSIIAAISEIGREISFIKS